MSREPKEIDFKTNDDMLVTIHLSGDTLKKVSFEDNSIASEWRVRRTVKGRDLRLALRRAGFKIVKNNEHTSRGFDNETRYAGQGMNY